MNREVGGVLVAAVGLLALIGAARGTWQKAWGALFSDSANSDTTVKKPNADAAAATGGYAGNTIPTSTLPGWPGSGITTGD